MLHKQNAQVIQLFVLFATYGIKGFPPVPLNTQPLIMPPRVLEE